MGHRLAYLILVINPGSTSTKISLFRDTEEVFKDVYHHTSQDLAVFQHVIDQEAYRYRFLEKFMEVHELDPETIDVYIGRGGMLKPLEGGIYRVSKDMIRILRNASYGEHASNLGALMIYRMAEFCKKPTFIANPIVVDEMSDIARVSGIPEIERKSIFHALNQKSAAEEASSRLGKVYEELNLIVVHMGGGISVGAHKCGRVVDVNNALNGDGPFSPERSGSLPVWDLANLVLSNRYNPDEMHKRICGKGGLDAYCETQDVRKLLKRAGNGDEQAAFYHEAMVYQIAKETGAMASVLSGRVDAIVLTGGIAHSEPTMELLKARIAYIAPIIIIPGEREMYALAENAVAALQGTKTVREYHDEK